MRLRLSCLLLPLLAACGKEPPAPVAPPPAPAAIVEPALRVEPEGETLRFLFDSPEAYAVTVTVRATLRNMLSDRELPLTRSIRGARAEPLLTLRPGSAQGREYRYEWRWQCGDARGVHDSAQVYLLPLAPGADYELIQGAGGSFSHQGASFNAYDLSAAEGTVVRAARGGVVCAIKEDSARGGPSPDFADDGNYVAVVHADGTVGWYLHLRQHGVVVEPGEAVKAGQLLAYSGNTGYSSRPHLHFEVYKPLSGYVRRSLPVRFATGGEYPQALEQGRYYSPTPDP
jgi:murein DD-endopeptidase MepM/ murein hydrolase activator NlpD